MTVGEILSVIKFAGGRAKAEQDSALMNAAFIAYYGGAYSRETIKLPTTIIKAFPSLFGRTSDGMIKAENWQESYSALERIGRRFQEQQRQVK